MSAHGCRVPAQANSDMDTFNTSKAMMEVVEKFKPDVVFFISSYNGKEYFKSLQHPLSKDHGYLIMDKMLKHFSKYSKAIIVNLPNFRYPTESIREGDARINKAYARVAALDCPKCYWWDYQEALCGDNYCDPIDPDTGLPLMRDFGHVSVLGMKKFIPILDKLTRKALNLTVYD
ncbi:hypothetical protein FO519_010113 [Halicephalobus sp. NKZ332]|nr:hypothetical protein FO519_010113 [Halicephalobus sp. NKZ332]